MTDHHKKVIDILIMPKEHMTTSLRAIILETITNTKTKDIKLLRIDSETLKTITSTSTAAKSITTIINITTIAKDTIHLIKVDTMENGQILDLTINMTSIQTTDLTLQMTRWRHHNQNKLRINHNLKALISRLVRRSILRKHLKRR